MWRYLIQLPGGLETVARGRASLRVLKHFQPDMQEVFEMQPANKVHLHQLMQGTCVVIDF